MVSDGTVQLNNVNHHVYTYSGSNYKVGDLLDPFILSQVSWYKFSYLVTVEFIFCYYSVCEETDTYADWYCKIETYIVLAASV